MKKLIALLLVFAMAVGMVACAPASGGGSKDTTGGKTLAATLDAQGNGLCAVCNKTVQWTKLEAKTMFDLTGKHHFYLADDLTFDDDVACLMTVLAKSVVCLNLNGHTLKTSSRIWTDDLASSSSAELSVFNIIAEGGKFVFTGRSAASTSGIEHNEGVFNLIGGSYAAEFVADAAERDLFILSRPASFKDAAIKGDIYLNSICSRLTLKGSTSVDGLIKIAFDERAQVGKEFVIESGWTGTATLEVPETALVDGVLDPTRYAATGDFTGTLKLTTGQQIVNNNGQLVVKQ